LRVPRFDPVRQIHRQHTHADGLDNVLVEILQPLVLGDFLFQRRVQPGVLDGDADVPGKGLEQFHVFAGQKITLGRLAQSQESDRLLLYPAGDVVVQVEQRNRRLRAGIFTRHLVRVVEEEVSRFHLGTRGAQETEIETGCVSHPKRFRQNEALRFSISFSQEAYYPLQQQRAVTRVTKKTD